MVVLYLGDCLEKMKSVADKSIDLIICDLPFGCLSINGNSNLMRSDNPAVKRNDNHNVKGCSWDIKIDLVEFWNQIKRIRKNDHTPTLMFSTTKYGFDLYNSNPKEFRYDLVWNKQRGVSFLTANKMPMRSHEMIYVFSKAGANYNRIDIEGDYPISRRGKGTKPSNVYNTIPIYTKESPTDKRCALSVITNQTKAIKGKHPTEKPIDLYKFLIERYSNSGDTVLDPTFGSGNSGLACNELNRKYIGIEKDNNFFWKFVKKL